MWLQSRLTALFDCTVSQDLSREDTWRVIRRNDHPAGAPGAGASSSPRAAAQRSGSSSASAILAACSNSTNAAGGGSGAGGGRSARAAFRWRGPTSASRSPSRRQQADRVGPAARDRRHVQHLQLPGLHRPALLKEFGKKYNVNGPGHAVRRHQLRHRQARIGRRHAGRHRDDARQPRPGRRRQADPAAQPRLHPEPAEERLARLVSPFYDVGVAVRRALHRVQDRHRLAHRPGQGGHPEPMPQPLDIFWESQAYTGKVALLSEVRETIAMALLRKGHLDINTEDPKLVNAAVPTCKQLYNICNIKVGDLQYETIPEDKAWLNQAWSGDMLSGYLLLPAQQADRQAAALLESRLRQGPDPERHVVRLQRHQEAGARPPVPELHAGQRRRATRTSSTSTATSRRSTRSARPSWSARA